MTAKETALIALVELQKAMPPGVLIIIGLPEEQEFLKVSAHLEPLGNRLLFMHAAAELLIRQDKLAGAAPQVDAPLFTMRVGSKECPVCLGSGKAQPGRGNVQGLCEMCSGLGLITTAL